MTTVLVIETDVVKEIIGMRAVNRGKDTFMFPGEIASYFVFMQNPKDICPPPQLRHELPCTEHKKQLC